MTAAALLSESVPGWLTGREPQVEPEMTSGRRKGDLPAKVRGGGRGGGRGGAGIRLQKPLMLSAFQG